MSRSHFQPQETFASGVIQREDQVQPTPAMPVQSPPTNNDLHKTRINIISSYQPVDHRSSIPLQQVCNMALYQLSLP